MRVISGRYRGKKLSAPSDEKVRPTTDRIKETIFNILQSEVGGAAVLDLFAGSGALGIECLSRGAVEVVFVDKNRESIALINENLRGIDGNYSVVNADFLSYIRSANKKFDLIFIDPPFAGGLGEIAVKAVSESGILAEDGIVIFEHGSDKKYTPDVGFKSRVKPMGSVTVDFIRKKSVAMVTGSFDPVTKGHEALIAAARERYDEVVAACLINEEKTYLFSPEQRLSMLKAAVAGMSNVRAVFSADTAVETARREGAGVLIRGIRGEDDECYETEMAEYNRERGIETEFIKIDGLNDITSTAVRKQLLEGDYHSLPEGAIMIAKEIIGSKSLY